MSNSSMEIRWQDRILTKFFQAISHPFVAFILFFLIMLVMFSMVKMNNSEDINFSTIHLQYSFSEFLTYCYQNRNGRFFVQTLYYFSNYLNSVWKWICSVSVAVCAYMIYKFTTIGKSLTKSEKTILAYLCCFIILIINIEVISPSMFWGIGAYSYLIPMTLGLIGFSPFIYSLQMEDYKPRKTSVLFLIPALLTIVGQEQVSLCFLAFALIVLIYQVRRKKTVPKLLWVIFFISLVVQILAVTAPGTAVRYVSEINRWFPEFSQLNLTTRLSISFYYLFNTIINQWYLVLLLLWMILATLLRKNKPDIFGKVFSSILYFYSLMMSLKFFKIPNQHITDNITVFFEKVFTFHFINPSTLQSLLYFIPYVVWGIGILLIPISIFLIFKKSKQSLFFICIFLAAIASISVMVFSPTLFVSGGRTSFVSNILLIILIVFLLQYNDLLKTFALPIIFLGICNITGIYLTWQSRGFKIFMGNLDISEIPFIVRGQ